MDKNKMLRGAISPYKQYCLGYTGQKNYITALVMGIGSAKKTFTHPGSKRLDSIVAYDRAEIDGAYIGQINMSIVSSFCGPQGLIWGYDIAKEEGLNLPSFLSPKKLDEFKGIEIINGENLRKAAKGLFGTVDDRHFPFLPGAHVPCAGKYYYEEGPVHLYAAIALGIPKDREKSACLFMEDVGKIVSTRRRVDSVKEKIFLDAIRSIIEVGKNQRVEYEKIFVDLVSGEIELEDMGCALVAAPYLALAKNAYTRHLTKQTLTEWEEKKKKYFLNR